MAYTTLAWRRAVKIVKGPTGDATDADKSADVSMLYRSCFRNAYVYVLRLSRAILLLNNGICYYLTSYAAHINVHISISSRRRRRPNLISLLRNGRKSPAVQVIIGLRKCTVAIMVWVLNRPRDI